jgi:hypothetical protein
LLSSVSKRAGICSVFEPVLPVFSKIIRLEKWLQKVPLQHNKFGTINYLCNGKISSQSCHTVYIDQTSDVTFKDEKAVTYFYKSKGLASWQAGNKGASYQKSAWYTAGLPDFSWCNIPKLVKNIPILQKYTIWTYVQCQYLNLPLQGTQKHA